MNKKTCERQITLELFDRQNGLTEKRLTSVQISDLLPVSRKTAERYIRDPELIPAVSLELMRLKAFGLCIPSEFQGFTFTRSGSIRLPGGTREFTPGDLLAYHWQIQRADLIDRQNNELEYQLTIASRSIEHWRSRAGQQKVANDD